LTVSIVIAGVSGDRAVDNCVASIRRIAGGQDLEVIVPRGEPHSVFQLRAQGIALATGDRIAVLGDRYEVTSPWLKALFERSAFDVTGGCVAPAASLNYWGWCVYLSEYAHIAPPVTEGATQQPKLVPGGNVLYNGSVVRRFSAAFAGTDLSFHSSLIEAGVSTGIRGDLEVCFAHPPGFSEYVRDRFWFSRTIGAEGGARRLLLAPLLPLVLLFRVGTAVMGKRRYRLRFLVCAPVILLLSAVQSAGEFAGALSRPA
jgi:hypothetical protein